MRPSGPVWQRGPATTEKESDLKRRTLLSMTMLVIGASLLVAASFANAASGKADARGGTLRIDSTSDFDYVDPALSYFSHVWQVEHVTCEKLLGFADKEGEAGTRPSPQIATGMPAVSKNGRTYTFTLKRNYQFSNGQPVTAQTFIYAWNRAMNPKMQSPAQSFMDVIVGAQAVFDGKAQTASGLKAIGNYKLQISLTKVAPDFLSRMTMPFFCPLPVGTPVVPEGIDAPVPGTGPYYIKEWTKKRSAVIARNPNYKGGRTANADQITYEFGVQPAAGRLRLEANQTDLGVIPATAAAELVQKYGLNKGRFFIRKNLVFWYLALNTDQALFKNNAKLRQGLNHAVDRPAMVRQHGFLGGGRTDQVLPVGMPGFKDWNIYSLKGANPAKGKSVAGNNLRGGKATMYTFNVSFGPTVAQVVQFNAKQIGLDVEIKQFDRVVEHEKMAVKGEPFDIGLEGWGADYPDPSNFINVLLLGDENIRPDHNQNVSYFNVPAYNKRMKQAATLSGDNRYKTYGLLDRDIMKNEGPLAPYINTNARILVGERVKNFTYHTVAGTLLNVVTVQ
jgi:ABC-type oligopeptide transport system substrate-binding subunit